MVTHFRHDLPGTSAAAWRARPAWSRAGTLDLTGVGRLVVVAAHPDDESLGAGGLLATAAAAGVDVVLLALTAGEHSHPASPTHTPAELAEVRRSEAARALSLLAPDASITWLAIEDGHVADHAELVVGALVDILGDGATALVAAPWRHDGHPDHEAAGLAASIAAHRCGARLVEYPVWWWHWADPDGPWPELVRLRLTQDALRRKRSAIEAHASQVRPLSRRRGDEVLLGPELLEHFRGEEEAFVCEAPADPTLDLLHARESDPWGVDHRWYEERKRALTLAALPRRRFARAVELGCSVGALTEQLAPRCDRVVGVDNSPAALREARRRPLGDHVELLELDLLSPDLGTALTGRFDLVVLSEAGYFLSPAALRGLMDWVGRALTPDGVVVLCHWTHPIEGWPLDGPGVHARFRDASLRPVQTTVRETDFEILVLADVSAWPSAAERGPR